jgi:hypothetical protein
MVVWRLYLPDPVAAAVERMQLTLKNARTLLFACSLALAALSPIALAGRRFAPDDAPPKNIVVLKGTADLKGLDDILKCKAWDELNKKAEECHCTVLKAENCAVVVDRRAFGLDVLQKRKETAQAMLALVKPDGMLVLDPATTPADLMATLQPSIDLTTASYTPDPGAARSYVTPVANVTIRNGSKTVETSWLGTFPQDKIDALQVKADPQILADWGKRAKTAPQSPLELPPDALNKIEVRFSGRPSVDERLSLMEAATHALAAEVKRLGDDLKDSSTALMAALMDQCGAPWGDVPLSDVKPGDLPQGGRDWLNGQAEWNSGLFGCQSGADAMAFLQGATVSVSFNAAVNVQALMPDGTKVTGCVVFQVGPRVRS